MNRTPNPGSRKAIAKGCLCPVVDNGYGRGHMGQINIFVVTETCPLHGKLRKRHKGKNNDSNL